MKQIPFEAAKKICEEFEKDQCIILTWDKSSGETWVTTFGVGDENSIQATNGGKMLKDYLKLQRENDAIPTRFEKWAIKSVDKYWYWSSRNGKTYVEVTYWVEPHTLTRKETKRTFDDNFGNDPLPDWAKSITKNVKNLNVQVFN